MPHRQLNDDALTLFNDIESDLYGDLSIPLASRRWVPQGEEVSIGDIRITCGNFYLGNLYRTCYDIGPNGPTGYKQSILSGGSPACEPSMIDVHLYQFNSGYKFSRYEITARSYHQLNGGQRHSYLHWLANNSPVVTDPPAFFLIYLSGIERRLFTEADEISSSEIVTIFKKLVHFRAIFASIDSVGIIDKAEMFTLIQSIEETVCYIYYNWIDDPGISSISSHEVNSIISSNVILSILHKISIASMSQQSIDQKTSLLWCLLCRTRYGTTFDEFSTEIADVFYSLFQSVFPSGYYPRLDECSKFSVAGLRLNNSIQRYGRFINTIYDYLDSIGPTVDLYCLLDESIAALKPFMAFMHSVSTTKNMLVGHKLLDIRVKRNAKVNSFIDSFTKWANEKIQSNDGHCSFNEFWRLTDCDKPSKLLMLHIDAFDSLLKRTGYIVIPGPAIGKKYSLLDSNITLIESDGAFDSSNSNISESCTQFIELVCWPVAINDNATIRSSRKEFLKRSILDSNELPINNRWILQHYSAHCINFSNGAKSPSKKILVNLSLDDIEIAKNLVLRTFLSSGNISPADLSSLEKFYKFIGANVASLPSDIHDASTTRSSRMAVRKPGFSLDIDLLNQHQKETMEVQSLLSSIFSDDEINEIPEVAEERASEITPLVTDKKNDSSPFLPGLSQDSINLLLDMETKHLWSESEFNELCDSHSLMPFGAIDSINQWAIDTVGYTLIEFDADIIIDLEILQEVRQQP